MAAPPSLPRDFPDRAVRDAVVRPRNLRAVLREAVPNLADRFDYARLEEVRRSYLLDDWRRRDLDVLARLPLLPVGVVEVFVGILVEHQTPPDPVVPLRAGAAATAGAVEPVGLAGVVAAGVVLGGLSASAA